MNREIGRQRSASDPIPKKAVSKHHFVEKRSQTPPPIQRNTTSVRANEQTSVPVAQSTAQQGRAVEEKIRAQQSERNLPIEEKKEDNLVSDLPPKLIELARQQEAIFADPNGIRGLQALNKLQQAFELEIAKYIKENQNIPGIDRETWQKLLNGRGAIKFADNISPKLKNHILATFARLMMLKEGALLVKTIINGQYPVKFEKVAQQIDSGLVAEALDFEKTKVKDVSEDTDSESDHSMGSRSVSLDSAASLDEKEQLTENVLTEHTALIFRQNRNFRRIPSHLISDILQTYTERQGVNRARFYPVKTNDGTASQISISGRVNDGEYLAGGDSGDGKLIEILCPSFILLGHELIHALHNQLGVNLREVQRGIFDTKLQNSFSTLEEFETIQGRYFRFSENALRRASGLPERTGHKHTRKV